MKKRHCSRPLDTPTPPRHAAGLERGARGKISTPRQGQRFYSARRTCRSTNKSESIHVHARVYGRRLRPRAGPLGKPQKKFIKFIKKKNNTFRAALVPDINNCLRTDDVYDNNDDIVRCPERTRRVRHARDRATGTIKMFPANHTHSQRDFRRRGTRVGRFTRTRRRRPTVTRRSGWTSRPPKSYNSVRHATDREICNVRPNPPLRDCCSRSVRSVYRYCV